MENKNILTKKIEYLSLEGGGGKGLVYLGAVRGLEEQFSGRIGEPLFDPLIHKDERQLKGVSATSAGAITGFMLALGMSSKEIQALFDTEIDMFLGPFKSNSDSRKVSVFEKFFDDDNYHNTYSAEASYDFMKNDQHKFHNFVRSVIGDGDLSKAQRGIKHENVVLKLYDGDVRGDGIVNLVRKVIMSAAPDITKDVLLTKALFTDELPALKVPLIPIGPHATVLTGLANVFLQMDSKNAIAHLNGLAGRRGLFSGFQCRIFFEKLVKDFATKMKEARFPNNTNCDDLKLYDPKLYDPSEPVNPEFPNYPPSSIPNEDLGYKANEIAICKLLEKIISDPWLMTFTDFYNLTGVNFVVAGSNISQQSSKYFSVFHTPDFPVIDAVSISMNFPIVFRPIYIDFLVNQKEPSEYNNSYKGLWADGGIFNNLPIHAFNILSGKSLYYNGEMLNNQMVAANEYDKDINHNENVLGLTIGERKDPTLGLDTTDLFNESNSNPDFSFGLGGLFDDLFSSILFNGSSGRLKGVKKENYIQLPIILIKEGWIETVDEHGFATGPYVRNPEEYTLPLLDFSTPGILEKRKSLASSTLELQQLERIRFSKQTLIDHAHYVVRTSLQ